MILRLDLLSAAALTLQGAPATPVAGVEAVIASIEDCSAAVETGTASLDALAARGWHRESRDLTDQAGFPPGSVLSRGPDPSLTLVLPGEEPGPICIVLAVVGAPSDQAAVESRLRELTGDNSNLVDRGELIFIGRGRLFALTPMRRTYGPAFRVAVMKTRSN